MAVRNHFVWLPKRHHWLTAVLMSGLIGGVFFSPALHANPRTGSVSPDAPPETAQFDFLIGDFEVTLHAWTPQGWTPPRPINARWRGWYGLEGRAIYDEWIDPDPARGNLGVNVRMYDPQEALWKMMWISTSTHQVQDLRAQMRDGVLTMWQVAPARVGWKAEFERLDADQWARVDYQQLETGEWRPNFRLVATRRSNTTQD